MRWTRATLPPRGSPPCRNGRKAAKGRRRLQTSTLTVTRPSGEQLISSNYALRTYNRAQWENAIGRSKLRVIGFTDVLGEPDEPEEPGYGLWILGPR